MYVVQEHAAYPLCLVIAAVGHLVLPAPLNRGPHTLRPTLMEQLSLTKLRPFLLAQITLQVLTGRDRDTECYDGAKLVMTPHKDTVCNVP